MGRRKLGDEGPSTDEKLAQDRYDPRVPMNRAWEQVAQMTIGAAVEAAYTVKGVDYLEVAKLVQGRSGGTPVGQLRPGDPNGDDVEQFILMRWGAGVYNLSPMYRGVRIRTRSFPIGGEAAFKNAVTGEVAGSELDNVDKQLADHVRRRSASATLRELVQMEKKEDEMTPEQLERILDKVVQARPADGGMSPLVQAMENQNKFLMEMLKLERDRADKLMAADRAPAADPNSLIGLAGLITPLLGKLKPNAVTSIVNGVMRVLNPREPAPESGWTPETVMAMVNAASPILQTVLMPLVDAFRTAFTPGGAPVQPATATVTPPAAIPATTRPDLRVVKPEPSVSAPIDLSPDEKMSMDLFFRFLGQDDWESAWGALGATEKTVLLNFAVLELTETQSPASLLPMFLKFDPRTNGQVAKLTEYLTWAKDVKAPQVIADEQADEAAEREESRRNGHGTRNPMPSEDDRA